MTNEQLYLAIGVPLVFNGLIAIIMSSHFNARINSLESSFRSEMSRLDAHLTERLLRVEQVFDARLKHLEEH